MKKRIIIISLIVLTIISILCLLRFFPNFIKKENTNQIESNTEIQEKFENDIHETDEKEIQEEKQSETNESEVQEDDNPKIEETKNQESTPTKQPSSTVPKTNQSTSPTQPVEQKPWEKLGMSEYDYYNKSDLPWATVSFSIKDYGTKDATINACIRHGEDRTVEKLNEGKSLSYTCLNLNSYAGNYIGEYYTEKELN